MAKEQNDKILLEQKHTQTWINVAKANSVINNLQAKQANQGNTKQANQGEVKGNG